jgi:hypothetical protein
MTEPDAMPDDGTFVLYDYDVGALVTTQVFPSYSEAADAIDPRLGNVLILPMPLDDAESSPPEDAVEGDDQSDICECQREGFFCSGVPGILAHLENGKVVTGTTVDRCDVCGLYPSGEAALKKLRELGMVGEGYRDYSHCPDSPDGKHRANPATAQPDHDAGRNRGTDWIIDFNCIHCGQSGSLKVDPADIQWE